MHTAVTHLNTVVFLEMTNQGATSLPLPDGKCRNDPSDQYLKDCYAHSSVMNRANNSIRPLMILTDAQCSAGQFIAVGTLQQVGGNFNGIRGASLAAHSHHAQQLAHAIGSIDLRLCGHQAEPEHQPSAENVPRPPRRPCNDPSGGSSATLRSRRTRTRRGSEPKDSLQGSLDSAHVSGNS